MNGGRDGQRQRQQRGIGCRRKPHPPGDSELCEHLTEYPDDGEARHVGSADRSRGADHGLGARLCRCRRTSGMRQKVARAIGSSVAKIGPICCWTSFARTNWLAQIKLHRINKPQSISRDAVRSLMMDVSEWHEPLDRAHRDGSLVGARLFRSEYLDGRLRHDDRDHLVRIQDDLVVA